MRHIPRQGSVFKLLINIDMVKNFLLCGVILALLVSCKAKVPEDIIDRGTMENLLYDYHLAQSLAKGGKDSIDFRIRLYTQSVFNKYGVSEEKFNHSMEWYTRNSEELFRIYKQIDKRFAEARTSGIVQGNRYASMTEVGDTMNIWKGKDFYLLTSAWNNHIDFQQEADSTFREGDKIMWQFEAHWYYREGQKNATALLAVVYENDSTAQSSYSLYSTGKQEITIHLGKKPVKSIEGFVYLTSPWTDLPKILTISDPVLVKFAKKEAAPRVKMKDVLGDQLKLAKDSVAVADSESKESEVTEKELQPKEPVRILSLPRK